MNFVDIFNIAVSLTMILLLIAVISNLKAIIMYLHQIEINTKRPKFFIDDDNKTNYDSNKPHP